MSRLARVGASRLPSLSVIVPTRNRALQLRRTLHSIVRVVDPDKLHELIVIDNGSSDDTRAVWTSISESYPRFPWRYVFEGVPGLLAGRHRGAFEANGDVLVYLDDDVVPESTWFSSIRDAFSDSEIEIVTGPARPRYEAPAPHWLQDLWHHSEGCRFMAALSLIECGEIRRSLEPYFAWGLNFSIRRETLLAGGGFHPDGFPPPLLRFRGDGEGGLAEKLRQRGIPAIYLPEAAVLHVIPAERLSGLAFERRAFAQGISDSFSRIRRAGGLPVADAREGETILPRESPLPAPSSVRGESDASTMITRMSVAHRAGVDFHEREARKDPVLLEWILRPNYFDYRLPAGWENQVDPPPYW